MAGAPPPKLHGERVIAWLPAGAVLLNNSGVHGQKAGEYALMATLMLATHMPAFAADVEHETSRRNSNFIEQRFSHSTVTATT